MLYTVLIAAIAIVTLIIVGVRFGIITLEGPPDDGCEEMYIYSVDQHGKKTGKGEWVKTPKEEWVKTPKEEWVKTPKEEVYQENGFEHLETYIVRLTTPQASSAILAVSLMNHLAFFILMFREEKLSITFLTSDDANPGMEQAIRSFFESRQMKPSEDRLTGDGSEYSPRTRLLTYGLQHQTKNVIELCRRLLEDVFGVESHQGLRLTYEESDCEVEPV